MVIIMESVLCVRDFASATLVYIEPCELFSGAQPNHGLDRKERGREEHHIESHASHGFAGERQRYSISAGFFPAGKGV